MEFNSFLYINFAYLDMDFNEYSELLNKSKINKKYKATFYKLL